MTNIIIVDPIVKLLKWNWLSDISFGSIIIRLFLAFICGGILGFDRAKKHQAAGFRTYILVCLGACVAMMTNQFIFESTGSGDSARLGAQVISGIGFLGAGTIIVTSRNQIKGLTTAAGLWACACLGLSIGIGFYTLSIIGEILLITIITILPRIENYVVSKSKNIDIHIEFDCRNNLKDFISLIRKKDIKIISVEYNAAYSASGLSVYTICLLCNKKINHLALLQEISELEYVNYCEEIK